MAPALKLDVDGVNALLRRAFPGRDGALFPTVTEVEPGRIHLVQPYHEGMLRPGGLISGPSQMGHADTAAYVLVLAHVGNELMAVTSSLVMNCAAPSPATSTPRRTCSAWAGATQSATFGSGPRAPSDWRPRPP